MTTKPVIQKDIIVKDTHRALWYEDGKLTRILEAGRYELPRRRFFFEPRVPKIEIVLVDVRERELTIKGQEILTSDKVAIRVSIIVQYRVSDARAAVQNVESYYDRLYTDVQLAARRSLASMPLEEILTNRNRLSEDIQADIKEAAATYGVTILRADVKDLIFPGNLQDIMNRVLAAERMSQAQLIEARTKAEVSQIEARTKADIARIATEQQNEIERINAQTAIEITRLKTEAEIRALLERATAAAAYKDHPALLRLTELETLRDVARTAGTTFYIGFDKQPEPGERG
jgi:regulator of protease activity HflC (stomatin/prohibitin superfamily)